jgi:hypothetical protein
MRRKGRPLAVLALVLAVLFGCAAPGKWYSKTELDGKPIYAGQSVEKLQAALGPPDEVVSWGTMSATEQSLVLALGDPAQIARVKAIVVFVYKRSGNVLHVNIRNGVVESTYDATPD